MIVRGSVLNARYFEDRTAIDGCVLCTKGHEPGLICPEFREREENSNHELHYAEDHPGSIDREN